MAKSLYALSNDHELCLKTDIPKLETTQIEGRRHYLAPNPAGGVVAYPSVTTVTGQLAKDSIEKWKKRVGEQEANRIRDTRSNIGNLVHEMAENYLKGEREFDVPPAIMDHFEPIQLALDQHITKIYALEETLHSHFLQVGGTVDCIAVYDGVLSVIDFKTSRKFKKRDWIKNYFMQESAYAVMWEELTGMPVAQLVTIMAVDKQADPLIFIEKRDDWIREFVKIRKQMPYEHRRVVESLPHLEDL